MLQKSNIQRQKHSKHQKLLKNSKHTQQKTLTNRSTRSHNVFRKSKHICEQKQHLQQTDSSLSTPQTSIFLSIAQAQKKALSQNDILNNRLIAAHSNPLSKSSQQIDLDQFSATTHSKPFMFPPTLEDRQKFMKQLHVTKDTQLYIYDDEAPVNSTRFLWQSAALGVPLKNMSIILLGSDAVLALNESNVNPTDHSINYDISSHLFPVPIVKDDIEYLTYNLTTDLKYRISDDNLLTVAQQWNELIKHSDFKQSVEQQEQPQSSSQQQNALATMLSSLAFSSTQRIAEQQLPLILDTRGQNMFVNGHIPGSLSLPVNVFFQNREFPIPDLIQNKDRSISIDGTAVGDIEHLNAIFEPILTSYQKAYVDAGINTQAQPVDVIFTCQTARTATVGWASLQSLLHSQKYGEKYQNLVKSARVYDNSWTVYGDSSIELDIPGWNERPKSYGAPSYHL